MIKSFLVSYKKKCKNLVKYGSIYTPAEQHVMKLRSRLRNRDFCLIANNCLGGVIMHDLGCRFQSPTVNMAVNPMEFVLFCEHLREYLETPFVEYEGDTGMIEAMLDHEQYGKVHFVLPHSKSFEEGMEQWEDRKKRVDESKVWVMMEVFENEYSEELMQRFAALPYPKVAVTHSRHTDFDWEIPLSCYPDGDKVGGKSILFRSEGEGRYIEEFDYVRFLNGEGVHYLDE